jgi:diguanylate cyclase (GGDEF)-like protein
MVSRSRSDLKRGDTPHVGILALYALRPGDELWNGVTHRRIGRIGAIWPAVMFGHVLALGVLIGVLLSTAPSAGPSPSTTAHIVTLSSVSLILLFAQATTMMLRNIRTLEPFWQVRLGVLLCAGQAASIAMLLDTLLAMQPGPARLVGLAGVSISAVFIACALSPVRALVTAFMMAMGSAFLLAQGAPVSLAMAGAMLPIALVIAAHAPRGDRQDQLRNARSNGDRELSMRLVHEYETHGSGWFWETDRDGLITYLSQGVVNAIDRSAPVIGSHLTDVLRLDSPDPESERTLAFHLSTRTSFTNYAVQAAGSDADRWWSISGRPVIDEIGQFRGFIGYGGDLTGKRRADAEISRMALFDGLTGLANRHRMRMSLDKALNQPGSGTRSTSLFMLDLDRFKAVNDTLGHQIGDALLKLVGQRLQTSIGDAGLVGRLGGDEFQVIIANEADRDRLALLAGSVISALSMPYTVNGTTISIGCSLGIATAPQDGADSETLIRNADLALYAAKAAGRGVHRFYHAELLAAAQGRRQLEDDLREAFVRGQFHLVYQSVVSTRNVRIVGYEALLRWNHPERGPISPADFIPIAEDCGLIERIGEWVLRTACEAAAQWSEDVRVAVNVSPIQFANPNLPLLVTSALAQSGLTSGRLELEITEGVFLNENSATDRMFASLKALGVRLALDDFGTGYSSLGYLKQAPFDKIKIDQSFVRGAIVPGSRNAAIIKAIVALAETLGMETTAEGVEVQDEIEMIRELGCSHIQGFVYGKPILAEEVAVQLADADGEARPSGVRISRETRKAMLRNAIVQNGSTRTMIRIRNITAKGVMVDGISNIVPGNEVMVEIFAGEPVPARVQWARDGKAGLQFAQDFEIDRLIAAGDAAIRRLDPPSGAKQDGPPNIRIGASRGER